MDELLKKLAETGQLAIIWNTDDVLSERPDLTVEQAWQVLQASESDLNEHETINALVRKIIREHATDLFPD